MKYIHVRNGMCIKVWNRRSNRRLYNCRFGSFTSAELTVAQVLIRQLCKRRFGGCASVESTIVQALHRQLGQESNQRLYNRWPSNWRLYALFIQFSFQFNNSESLYPLLFTSVICLLSQPIQSISLQLPLRPVDYTCKKWST